MLTTKIVEIKNQSHITPMIRNEDMIGCRILLPNERGIETLKFDGVLRKVLDDPMIFRYNKLMRVCDLKDIECLDTTEKAYIEKLANITCKVLIPNEHCRGISTLTGVLCKTDIYYSDNIVIDVPVFYTGAFYEKASCVFERRDHAVEKRFLNVVKVVETSDGSCFKRKSRKLFLHCIDSHSAIKYQRLRDFIKIHDAFMKDPVRKKFDCEVFYHNDELKFVVHKPRITTIVTQ